MGHHVYKHPRAVVAWIIVDANAMHGSDLRPDLRTIYAAIHDHCNIINGTYLTDFIS